MRWLDALGIPPSPHSEARWASPLVPTAPALGHAERGRSFGGYMGRLKNLPPRVTSVAPKVARHTDDQGHGSITEPWRAWYSLARWRSPEHGLRMRVLIRDRFTCQLVECGRIERRTHLLVADHVIPHRGDAALFWDEGNLQTLCKDCHDRVKQAEERAGLI